VVLRLAERGFHELTRIDFDPEGLHVTTTVPGAIAA
jgi:hypothetical protein